MIVLLPPSETKATRSRGRAMDLSTLSLPELTQARQRVIDALAAVSVTPDAANALGVSPNLAEDIARNTRLLTSPAVPASSLYTGVLYDALDLASLTGGDKARAGRRIIISSALYGAVRLRDKLAPYRLSMATHLPGVGALAGFWKTVLDEPLTRATGRGLVVDCRSSTYAASWSPSGDVASRWVHIRVPGATHGAKHTRGLVTRALVTDARDPRTPRALAAQLGEAFDVELTAPAGGTKPWILDVSAP